MIKFYQILNIWEKEKKHDCKTDLRAGAAKGGVHRCDFAELFVENTLNHTIDMVDSLVDDRHLGSRARSVRVFKGCTVSAPTVDYQ